MTDSEAAGGTSDALARLDEITRRLRRECPWDREQDERSIVPHTVEEAYELADAAHAGDDAKLLDELGDVLFQVYFLSLLMEERGAGDLAQVAEHCRAKLIRRHPHVFGDAAAESAADVLRNWDAIKREDERSIVPHTVEEAYELADAAHSGDDAKLLDELGDVLFQVYFLSLLLEERGCGDLAAVAAASREKLVRRHPHIFRDDDLAGLPTNATTPSEVRENWDAIKLREGRSAEVADALPALTYARKRLKKGAARPPGLDDAMERLARARKDESPGSHHGSQELYDAVGELLLAAVELAVEVQVDPEVALRRAVSA